MILRNLLFVGIGGAFGSIARYALTNIIGTKPLPIATFTVNTVGSFLIGLLMGCVAKQTDTNFWQLILITGFCGGFTTFSALSWDMVIMIQQQRFLAALFYVFTTLLLGLLFAFWGFWIGK